MDPCRWVHKTHLTDFFKGKETYNAYCQMKFYNRKVAENSQTLEDKNKTLLKPSFPAWHHWMVGKPLRSGGLVKDLWRPSSKETMKWSSSLSLPPKYHEVDDFAPWCSLHCDVPHHRFQGNQSTWAHPNCEPAQKYPFSMLSLSDSLSWYRQTE